MITDLRPDISRASVDEYIDGLKVELDKLYISLQRNTSLGAQEQAKIVWQIREYVRVTQVYPNKPRGEEPPRGEEEPPK
jgi:hypothetical protein